MLLRTSYHKQSILYEYPEIGFNFQIIYKKFDIILLNSTLCICLDRICIQYAQKIKFLIFKHSK